MKWFKTIGLFLCLSIPMQAQADEFSYVVLAHFQAAEACWKQDKIPTLQQVRLIVNALNESADRWWPECRQDALSHMFALGLTEGGGNVDGVAADPDTPSYGFFHIKEPTARIYVTFYGIQPYCKWIADPQWFKSALKTNIRAGILAGAACMRVLYNQHDGDWMRVVLNYKYGDTGFKRAINGLQGKPLSTLSTWQHYCRMKTWLDCIRTKVVGLNSDYCDCLNTLHQGDRPK